MNYTLTLLIFSVISSGLFNRHYILQRFPGVLSLCIRNTFSGRSFNVSFFLIHLYHGKQINEDSFDSQHETDDQVVSYLLIFIFKNISFTLRSV